MTSSKVLINTLIFLLIFLALFAGYFYLRGGGAETGSAITTQKDSATLAGDDSSTDSEFVTLLNRLDTVTLDASFLSDVTFSTNLENYATVLLNRPKGRSNPFADFGIGNLTEATSTTPINSTSVGTSTNSSSLPGGGNNNVSEPVDE